MSSLSVTAWSISTRRFIALRSSAPASWVRAHLPDILGSKIKLPALPARGDTLKVIVVIERSPSDLVRAQQAVLEQLFGIAIVPAGLELRDGRVLLGWLFVAGRAEGAGVLFDQLESGGTRSSEGRTNEVLSCHVWRWM